MPITDSALRILELDVLRVSNLFADDAVEADHSYEVDRVQRRVFTQALELIAATREFRHLTSPHGNDYNYECGSNDSAQMDFKLPAFVRAFLAIRSLNATCVAAIHDAGYMPKLYGRYKGRGVRVVMVSRLGDIGISHRDEEPGYFTRCSIYDLSDYALSMPASKVEQVA